MGVHRGDSFQAIVNMACKQYYDRDIAVIKEISASQGRSRDGKLYYKARDRSRTSLDYAGAYKFIPITFDAKETLETTRFPLKNIEPIQVEIMGKWQKHGICFLLVNFLRLNVCYRIYYPTVAQYWQDWQEHKGKRGHGSIPLEVFEQQGDRVNSHDGIILDFLSDIDKCPKLGLQRKENAQRYKH